MCMKNDLSWHTVIETGDHVIHLLLVQQLQQPHIDHIQVKMSSQAKVRLFGHFDYIYIYIYIYIEIKAA